MFSKVMLLVTCSFVIGIAVAGFVFGFLTTNPSSGVYHQSNEIVCDNCITSSNLASDSVNSIEITDGQILDSDISSGANIDPFKVKNINGVYVGSGSNGISFGAATVAAVPLSSNWGVGSWIGKRLEVICEPGINPEHEVKAGATLVQSSNYETTYNYHSFFGWSVGSGVGIIAGLPGDGWSKVYEWKRFTTSSGAVVQSRALYMRPDDNNPNQLEVGQTSSGVGASNDWRCVIHYGSN
ncbi:MAG: hypothetical protein ACP5NS_03375 [Candidatus Pacearchaeota archaeon]